MPPSTGQKRNRQIPSNNSLITNFYQPQKKRQDTKISSNNENQVSFDQFKKEHLQSFKKRGLGESTGLKNNNNNNKTNKKTTERQPLQQIGGLATNKNLNTGLKNKPGQEQRDAWCVYSDPPENDYGDDNSNDFAAVASQAPFVVFRDFNEQENKNDNNDENKKGETDKEGQVSLRNTQRQEQTQENKYDNGEEPTEKNNINNDKVRAPLALQKQNTFNFSDDNFSDEEDEHKGFFDDDEDDMLITTTKRPNMNALGTISRQQQQQREEAQESDLVPEFSIPQFNIPVQSPVFDDPEPSDDDDDDCDKENEDTPLFPALLSSPTPTTSNTDENNSQSGSSIEKHDSKLDDSEKYNNINQTTQASSNITTTTTAIATHNSSSLDTKSISSIEATIPMEPTKQYETHVPYPLPRGKTLLEKFGIEKMSSDTSTSSSGSSTNQSLEVSCSKDQTVGDSSIRQLDEDDKNFEDDGRLLPATVPMDPAEQQYEAHVPYAVPRGTSLLEKLGLQSNDDAETP